MAVMVTLANMHVAHVAHVAKEVLFRLRLTHPEVQHR